jgi:hypothetical protein
MDIKDTYTRVFLQAANQLADSDAVKKHKPIWWWNFRSKDSGGLRLTEEAMTFIQEDAKIKTYKIEFPKEFAFTPQVLVWLDNFIDSPFYITKKFIVVLKEKAAFELYLFSGDVKKLGYNKALAKRLSQESVPE